MVPGIIYRPPELLAAADTAARAASAAAAAHPAADIWAFGVISFELLTNSPAFSHGSTRKQIADQISGRAGGLPWEAGGPGEPEDPRLALLRGMRPLVLQCLSRNPTERPAAAEVAASVDASLQLDAVD